MPLLLPTLPIRSSGCRLQTQLITSLPVAAPSPAPNCDSPTLQNFQLRVRHKQGRWGASLVELSLDIPPPDRIWPEIEIGKTSPQKIKKQTK